MKWEVEKQDEEKVVFSIHMLAKLFMLYHKLRFLSPSLSLP